MSEQKTEEEVKPSKKVSDQYWQGYRAGYNKGYDRASKKAKEKKSNLEIEVKKDAPIKKEVNEVKEVKESEVIRPQASNSRITIITAIIIALVLGGIIWYVLKSRNRESSK